MRGTHTLGAEALRARVEERLAWYESRYPHLDLRKHYQWLDGRRASAEYRGGRGTVTLGDADVTVEMELPFFARPFKGRIEHFVQQEIDAVTRSA